MKPIAVSILTLLLHSLLFSTPAITWASTICWSPWGRVLLKVARVKFCQSSGS